MAEFPDQERLAIALRIVSERARVGYALWDESRAYLELTLNITEIDLVDDDASFKFVPFRPGYAEALTALAQAIDAVVSDCGLQPGNASVAWGRKLT